MKKRIKVLLFFATFSIVSHDIHAQGLKKEQLDIITKNILSYHFRYALKSDLNLKSDKVMQGSEYFFDELWPKNRQSLKLNISQSELKYPLEGFIVYEVKKRGFQIGNDSLRISKKLTSFQADNSYLVAVDTESNELKFISGNFFQSTIENDFKLDVNSPKTFIYYLKFRLFNWSAETIFFKKRKKGKIIFTAYSKYLKSDILIEVNTKDFDQVKIRQLKKTITY